MRRIAQMGGYAKARYFASVKTDHLDSLLKEFGDRFDRPNMETARPYKCDFLKLRDKALGAFALQ